MDPSLSSWTAKAVADHLGVSAQRVSSWITAGLVEPARRGRGRRGHDLGVTGLLEALAVRDLQDAGFATREVRRAVETLRGLSGEDRPLSKVCVAVFGDDVMIRDEDELVSLLRHPAQRVMLFRIGRACAELTEGALNQAL